MAARKLPEITIPGVPKGKCCLWQIDKVAAGNREATDFGELYDCETGRTQQATVVIKLELKSTRLICDQIVAQKLLPDGSVLEAKGGFTFRSDGFAHFTGSFTIQNVDGKRSFQGTIELMDRVGTHRACEKCNEKSHLEGWLVGRASEHDNLTLRAMIALKGVSLSPDAPKKRLSGIINGALIVCN